MKQQSNLILRILVLVLLSLTAAMTLLGAIGTTCVAFNAEKYGPRMALMAPVKPVLQVLVFVSLAAGLVGVFSIVQLARSRKGAYQQALSFLLVGAAASGLQFYYSLTLRGSTAPNNVRLYLTGFTLLVLLLLRLPGLWQLSGLGNQQAGSGKTGGAGGIALLVCGLVVITTPVWAAPTHMFDGNNTVNVLLWPLLAVGTGLILLGGLRLFGVGFGKSLLAAEGALSETKAAVVAVTVNPQGEAVLPEEARTLQRSA
jgi:hypothetical protein